MKKKLLALGLAGALLFSVSAPVMAIESSFSDVTEEDYPWAIEAIEDMTTDGIIKGYTDGTFRPAQSITKMEALILSARVLGYTKDANKPFTDYAYAQYKDVVDQYDIKYKEEVAYLLYKGVLKESELDDYISATQANAYMLRWEAAILLAKVMGGEEMLNPSADLLFVDKADIPASAVPYVAFVNEIGLMGSMSETEQIFNPNFAVNRAQMAVLLYRIMDMIDMEIEVGKLSSLNSTTRRFTLAKDDGTSASLTAKASTAYLVNGKEGTLDDFVIGETVAVISKNGNVDQVETFYEKAPDVVSGAVSSISSVGISLEDPDTGEVSSYTYADSMSVTLEGEKATVADIKKWFYAEVSVNSAGKVIAIASEPKTTTVEGTVSRVLLNPVGLEVEFKNGDTERYFAQNTVTVRKNGLTSNLDQIGIGDKVTLTLTYRQISSVNATSDTFTVTGTIKEILISASPSLTIDVSGVEKTYYLSREAVYQNADAQATIYDLRLGATAKLKVEGMTATQVTMETSSEASTYTGVIESYNASYRLMNLKVTDTSTGSSETKAIFLKKSNGTAIIINGQSSAYTALKEGMTVTVFGASTNGAYEATAIVVQ